MDIDPELRENLRSIFYSHALMPFRDMKDHPERRFSYYTSATTGLEIIRRKEVWLRNAALMNDFSEVHHGQNCLHAAWATTKAGERLRALITLMGDDALQNFITQFDSEQTLRTYESYLLCISEHGGNRWNEEKYGRLSMWRAYGGNANVAFIFRSEPFVAETDALEAYSNPVIYEDTDSFQEIFSSFVKSIDDNFETLRQLGWNFVWPWLYTAMRSFVLATKHPGFAEEREWRVIFSPHMAQKGRLFKSIEVIDGTPQRVYKLPLKNIPEEGLTGIEMPELLDRVIIGPTNFPIEIRAAYIDALRSEGVEDAENRVIVSGIPLRRGQ